VEQHQREAHAQDITDNDAMKALQRGFA
jgi:hypothetical protein